MEIQKMVTDISKSINDNKLVVFVGAGVSRNYGYPDWNELTDKILNEINIEKHLEIKEKVENCKNPIILANKKTIRKAVDSLGYATDDYLIYAQYLYDYLIYEYKEEGKKKYKEIVKKILEDKKKVKTKYEIIQKIFQLSPQHIITTNYDTLIEDCNKGIYKTIAEDKQLANTTLNSYIIKMHGDFKHKHFVLKESDYHNYKDNFKLIDNFIRSIFATHTLLFVGFSANDPNFKQIYAWIGKILKKNTRNAFFINLKKENFNIHKTRYFKNKHINILHFEDLQEYHNDSIKIKDYGKRLEYCLDHLSINYIDNFMVKIKQLRYSKNPEVWGIEEFLKSSGVNINYDEISISNKQILNFVKSTTDIDSRNKKIFFNILLKLTSNDGKIKTETGDIILTEFVNPIPKYKIINEINFLTDFKFDLLESTLNSYPIEPTLKNHTKLQRKAFLLNMISEKEQSYNILTTLLSFYKRKKMYFDYFKTGLNRNYTYKFGNKNMKFFNFNYEINLLSTKERNTYFTFLDYMQKEIYYNKLIKEVSKTLDQIIDLEIFFNRGGMQHSSLINQLKLSMNNTFKVIYEEGICSNYSELFKLYLKSYFISYYTNIKCEKYDKRLNHIFGLSKVTELDFNYIYYAIQFLSPADWNNILDYSDQNLVLSNDLKNKIIINLQNISKCILLKKDWNRNNSKYFVDRLCNFIILFSNIVLESSEFIQIIENLSPVIFKFDVYHYNKYLKKLCEKHKEFFLYENSKELGLFFQNLILSLEDEKHLNALSDYKSILSLLNGLTFQKKLWKNNKSINNIKILIENEKGIFDKCIGINMLISVFQHGSTNLKTLLSSYILNFFKVNFTKAKTSIHFYLCIEKAIKNNVFHKKEETLMILKMLKQPLSSEDNHFIVYLDSVYQLKKANKINQKDINKYLGKYSKVNTFYRAFLFEENFTIPKKELRARWLLHLVDNPDMLFAFINNFKINYKELILKINKEIVSNENLKHQDKYIELLTILLERIDDEKAYKFHN